MAHPDMCYVHADSPVSILQRADVFKTLKSFDRVVWEKLLPLIRESNFKRFKLQRKCWKNRFLCSVLLIWNLIPERLLQRDVCSGEHEYQKAINIIQFQNDLCYRNPLFNIDVPSIKLAAPEY